MSKLIVETDATEPTYLDLYPEDVITVRPAEAGRQAEEVRSAASAAAKITRGTRVRITDLTPAGYWFKPSGAAEVTGTVRSVRRTRSALPVSVEIDGAGPAEGRPLAHVDPRHVEVIAAG